jgi:hypothetical protein
VTIYSSTGGRISQELVNGTVRYKYFSTARGRSSEHNLSDMFFANEASHYLGHAATLQLVIFASASLNIPNVLPKPALSPGVLGAEAIVVEQSEIVDDPLSSEEQSFQHGTEGQGRKIAQSHHGYQAGCEQDAEQNRMGRKSSRRRRGTSLTTKQICECQRRNR